MKQAGSKKTARCIRSPVKYHAWQFPHCVSVRLGFSLHLQQQSLRLQRQGNKASRRTSGQHDILACRRGPAVAECLRVFGPFLL